jgi:putative ABC transport system substrate-binding protein
MIATMKRRDFIALIGGAAAWPLAARAQQSERMRRIGILIAGAQSDPNMQERVAAFLQTLEKLGWSEGRNIETDIRFAAGKPDQYGPMSKELTTLQPDVIFAYSTPIAAALQRESRTIPIVFVNVSDPIGSGLVASLARPGGNVTGLMLYEEGITGKWLALLKEIAPQLERVALMANPNTMPYDYYVRSAKATAPSLGIEVVPNLIANAADIAHTIESFAQKYQTAAW